MVNAKKIKSKPAVATSFAKLRRLRKLRRAKKLWWAKKVKWLFIKSRFQISKFHKRYHKKMCKFIMCECANFND